MSALSPLLEVQALDLESDGLKKKLVELPERAALAECESEMASIDAALAESLGRKAELGTEEERLGGEVSSLSAKAEALQLELYSGKRKSLDETATRRQEHEVLKLRQTELEEEEMALLERIDEVDGEIAGLEERRRDAGSRSEALRSAIAAAETRISEQLAGIDERRTGAREGLPANVLAAYAKGRESARQGGVAAARMGDGSCDGCRVKLPVLEFKRLKEAPELDVIHCPQCRRILIR